MKRGSWFNAFAANENSVQGLAPQAREEISRLDDALYALEPWRQCRDRLDLLKGQELRLLSVRHYAIPEAIHAADRVVLGKTVTVHLAGASERMKLSRSQISFSLSVDLKAGIIFTPLLMR